MDGLKPIVLVNSLKTVGKAFAVWRSNWRRLRLVMLGLFLLNLALTVAMVKLASQHVNLDSVRPFFEIAVNSTTTGVGAVAVPNEGTDASLSWQPRSIAHVDIGEFFTVLSMSAAIIFFSYTCNCNLPADKACLLAGEKFLEIIVLGTMILVVQDFLDDIYVDGMHLLYRKEQEETSEIRKGTVAEIFLISITPALLTLVLQVFQCLVILAFYGDGRLPTEQLGDGNDITGDGGSDASSSAGGKKTN